MWEQPKDFELIMPLPLSFSMSMPAPVSAEQGVGETVGLIPEARTYTAAPPELQHVYAQPRRWK